jgi:hypothetical protein
MSLVMFQTVATTDGATRVSIIVEPGKRACNGTITISGRIVRMFDETEPSFRPLTHNEFTSVDYWDRKAHELAKLYSPFWRGVSAA